MAAECSWSARYSGCGDIAHETDHVSLPIADESDPDLARSHARDHVGFLDGRRSGRGQGGVDCPDVSHIVVDDGPEPVGFGATALRSAQHQLHSTAVEERELRRRIEEVPHAEHVTIKPRRLDHIRDGYRDLPDLR